MRIDRRITIPATAGYVGALVAVTTMLLVLSSLVLAARPAHAVSTFTVNRTDDLSDSNTSDNVCDTLGLLGSQCSLRAAIQQANATANSGGPDVINFNIAGTGVKTISPTSEFPSISQPVTIDGYTQPGASVNTARKGTNANLLIELNGQNAGDANGFTVTGGGTTIRGLVINRFQQEDVADFDGNGVFLPNLAPNTNNVVEGNFIGTDSSGTQDLGNDELGVLAFNQSTNNRVGGPDLEDRNLISANGRDAVGADSSQNTVEGNLLGTDKGGTQDLGNGGNGVEVAGSGNLVASNTIAFNGKDGFSDGVVVVFASSTDNRIQRNSIFSNAGLGIDLNNDGPTANDGGAADDADTGPNGLQNKPELTSATTTGTAVTVSGRLDTKPNRTFRVEFFSQGGGDEGKKFVGVEQVQTDEDGRVNFGPFVFNKRVTAGQNMTATATGPEGTSEFSAPEDVVAQ